MNEWIITYLPWNCYINYNDKPKIPDLSDREKEHFGNCEKELFIEWRIEELEEALWCELESCRKNFGSDTNHPEYIAIKSLPKYFNLKKYRSLQTERNIWDKEQPEVQEYDLAIKKFYYDHDQKSFTGRGLDKPGTLVEFAKGEQILIGTHYNNDTIEMEAVVIRYKIVWTPEK